VVGEDGGGAPRAGGNTAGVTRLRRELLLWRRREICFSVSTLIRSVLARILASNALSFSSLRSLASSSIRRETPCLSSWYGCNDASLPLNTYSTAPLICFRIPVSMEVSAPFCFRKNVTSVDGNQPSGGIVAHGSGENDHGHRDAEACRQLRV
jgi:hypothetical protein